MALTQISTDGIKNGTITGSDLATNVDLVDNQKLRLGTGNDLQIYHDGSNSFISDTGTGGIKILGSDIYIKNPSDHDMIHASSGGAVSLFHNNSKKFETTSGGVQVTDNLNMSGGHNAANMVSIKKAMSNIPDKRAILHCPTCKHRHGGELADTKMVSWRCKKCKKYIYGAVTDGNFNLWCSTKEEINTKPKKIF